MTKTNPVCIRCNAVESLLWRPAENGEICNDCFVKEDAKKKKETPIKTVHKADMKQEPVEAMPDPPLPVLAFNKVTRKSSRSTRYKMKTQTAKNSHLKGRGRRSLFKRTPVKAPTSTATIITSESIYFKGFYLQVGDIMSMNDEEGDTYYAQIRGFMTDEYCEKSAVVTWLLPTKASPPPNQCFDPATYIIGPEEDLPRKLDYMEFVMHAPSEYYRSPFTPYPPTESYLTTKYTKNFIWASMEPQYK